MASGPITSWEIDGETVETYFIFLGSKITADGDCSHEIKRYLLLGRRSMTNLDHIFFKKQRHYYFAAAAAKSLQSCPTLSDPLDGSPPGSAVPGTL